jgi:hypothetical protein
LGFLALKVLATIFIGIAKKLHFLGFSHLMIKILNVGIRWIGQIQIIGYKFNLMLQEYLKQ